ncbi:MAG: nucleotidyltransferase domain-containing protein [Candidatus Eremiobacteraeota bacterium]|nr:nucleotidyltransferase domain-containing protein [Candidatus Eremiobacteraeota bacterium]
MTRLERLTPLEAEIAAEFAAQVRARYGPRARCIKLFGSRARRDARDDSDMDVLVLIQDCSLADRGAVSLLLERWMGFEVTPRVMAPEQFERLLGLERLFPKEVVRDGIDL